MIWIFGAPGEIRTPDLQVRSLTLYPAELRTHYSHFSLTCVGMLIFNMHSLGTSGTYTEREIKLPLANVAEMRSRLAALGFQEVVPRQKEVNCLYDFPGAALRSRGELLRLRSSGGLNVLTFKAKATTGKHKEREEIEVTVGDSEPAQTILERLGLVAGFRYEKFRSTWQRPAGSAGPLADGVIVLDETPIGNYLELEGAGDWIDRTALELGFTEADYIQTSYGRLYLEHCQQQGITPGHMLFP